MAGLYLSRPCMSVKNVYEGLEIRMCGTLSKENIKILDYVIFLKNMTGWWWQADRCKNRPLTESWRCRLLPLIVLPVLTVGASLMQKTRTKRTHTNLDQDYQMT